MPLDPNLIIQPRRVAQLSPDEAQANAMKLSQMQMAMDEQRSQLQDKRTLSDLYRNNIDANGNINAAGITKGLAASGMGDRIPEFQTKQADYSKAVAGMNTQQLEFHKKQLDAVNGSLASLLAKPDLSHDDVINEISGMVDNGIIDNASGAKMVQQLPGPDQLRGWLTQRAIEGMDQSKKLESVLPKYDEQDRGGVINQGTINPITGQRTAGVDVPKTMTPDATATQQQKKATSFGTQEGDLLAALAEQGVSLPAGMRSKEQQLATVRSLISRNPGMSPDEIAYKVGTGQIKFGADKQTTTAAEKDFATGKSGQMLRSIGTANKHLTMLDGMVDSLNNGDVQAFNKLGNTWAKQTGAAAPNSFDAVKHIVGQEVVKAIVAGGGGVNEREEAGNAISSAGSPAQLKDVIARYRQIMAAQRESLVQQHRALKLPDSALPDYEEGAYGTQSDTGDAGIPPDIAALLKKHGGS
jgi:hypothetical protein